MPTTEISTRRHILDTARQIITGKGYAAVGLNEVLAQAEVPKGSFYHYFSSKEGFGEALLQSYFEDYLATIDRIASAPATTGAERLMDYWERFLDLQLADDCQGRCLVVKLAAEVSDLSDVMRQTLAEGTAGIVDRVAGMIEAGRADGSLTVGGDPRTLAAELYDSWLGASIMAKIQRSPDSLRRVMSLTRTRLGL